MIYIMQMTLSKLQNQRMGLTLTRENTPIYKLFVTLIFISFRKGVLGLFNKKSLKLKLFRLFNHMVMQRQIFRIN